MKRAIRAGMVGGAAGLLQASGALAQSAHTPAADVGTTVRGVTVIAPRPTRPPTVVSTFPAQGATVAPGTLILTVRFDQRMTADGWSYSQEPGADHPACLPRPRLLEDGRTFVLLCSTVSGRPYAVGLNASPAEGFANAGRRFAPRYDLRFTTAATGEPVRAVSEAVAAAGLRPQDNPIMTWRGVAETSGSAQDPDSVPPP